METTSENPPATIQSLNPVPPESTVETTQFEFNQGENEIIANLAWKMHFVGLFVLAIGLLVIVIGIIMFHVFPIFSGTLYAVIGIWTQRAADSFRNVVYTQGKDITHLMAALDDLRKLYTLQFWLCVIGLVGTVAGLVAVTWFRLI